MKNTLFFIFINLTWISSSLAQSVPNSPTYKTETFFNASIQQQSRLYNGPSYPGYAFNVDGSANFQDLTAFSNGSVVYDGFRFDNVPLMYDIYQDKLISQLNGYAKYSLISDRVADFYLNNHHFKYINVIDSTKSVIKSGFYDLIHDGKSKIYVKKVKNMQQVIDNKMVRFYFIPKTYYYLERDQKYSIISNEKSFLNYFNDKKVELKKLLKEKKIKFRKQPEDAMILLASYYENLTN